MWWLVAILISISLGAVSVLLQRSILKADHSDPVVYSIVFQLLIGLLLFIYGFVTTTMDFSGFWSHWPQWLLLVLLYGFGNVAVFASLKRLAAGDFQMVFAARALFTVISSWLVLNQNVSLRQLLGMVLIGWAVWLVTERDSKNSQDQNSSKLGLVLGLLAAACFGVANTNDSALLQEMPLFSYLPLAFSLPALGMMVLYYRKFVHPGSILRDLPWKKVGLMSLIYGVAAIFFFSALTTAPQVAQVVTINQVQIVLVVLLGAVVLGERKNLHIKALAAGLSLIGSWLVV